MLLYCKIVSANLTVFHGKLHTFDGVGDSFSFQMQLDQLNNTVKQPIR